MQIASSITGRRSAAPPQNPSLFAPDYRETPYWWTHAEPPQLAPLQGDIVADVAVIGSGYTGLHAAIQTTRGGRRTVVLDAENAGWGCSTRNGGQISTSIKPGVGKLAKRFGEERARAIHAEGAAALEWIERFIIDEGLDCDFRKAGRFHAAHSPKHYEALARSIGDPAYGEDVGAHVVPRAEQHSEIGTDAYFGGVVYPRHRALHPARYHRGLTGLLHAAGGEIFTHSPVIHIETGDGGHILRTPRGTVKARDVIVATNGYTGPPFGWLRRRVIPIGSYIIATEALPEATIDRLFPQDRAMSDTRRVVYYYRASPDRRRVLFGGRVSANETNPAVSGPLLHAQMVRIFPELAQTPIAHSWCGTVAYSFDELAHTGVHDGVHFAMAYCGSGVSMASYQGMKMGRRVLGHADGKSAFDGLPFPTRPFYTGKPWFLPAAVTAYRWLDEFEFRRN